MPTLESSRAARITGVVLSVVAVLFFSFDGVMKLVAPPPVVEGSAQMGVPADTLFGIGAALLVATLLYAIPRTAVLGALLVTAYLGGAVAMNVRIDAPLFSHTLFPVYFAVVVWAALLLRRPALRALVVPASPAR